MTEERKSASTEDGATTRVVVDVGRGAELGPLVSAAKQGYTYRRGDGEHVVPRRGHAIPERGSFAHARLCFPDQLAELATAQPTTVLLAWLQTQTSPQKAQDLKAQLTGTVDPSRSNTGIAPVGQIPAELKGQIARLWKLASSEFKSHPDVVVDGAGSAQRFSIRYGRVPVPNLLPFLIADRQASRRDELAAGVSHDEVRVSSESCVSNAGQVAVDGEARADGPDAILQQGAESPDTVPAPRTTGASDETDENRSRPPADPEDKDEGTAHGSAPPEVHTVSSTRETLLDVVRSLTNSESVTTADIASRPLHYSTVLADATAEQLLRLSRVKGAERRTIDLALWACPRELEGIGLGRAPRASALTMLIQNATREMLTRQRVGDLAGAWAHGATKLTRSVGSGALAADLALRFVAAGARLGLKDQRVAVQLAEYVENLVSRDAGRDVIASEDDDVLDGLAVVLGWLPLDDKNRAACLAALGAQTPRLISHPRWWAELTVDALHQLATTRLASLLRRDDVSSAVVKPLVQQQSRKPLTRRMIGDLISLPDFAAAHVDPGEFAAAWRRAAQENPTVQAWLNALVRPERLDAAKSALALERQNLARLQGDLDRASRSVAALEEKVERLTGDLEAARSRRLSEDVARDRQIRIDLLRALAQVAVAIATSPAADDGPLADRLKFLLERQGLRVLGAPGMQVAFEPEQHELITGAPAQRGDEVTVRNVGYVHEDQHSESVVLIRALVE